MTIFVLLLQYLYYYDSFCLIMTFTVLIIQYLYYYDNFCIIITVFVLLMHNNVAVMQLLAAH